MKQRSRFFVANIVLGCIFGIFLIICIAVMFFFHLVFKEMELEAESGGVSWEEDDWIDMENYGREVYELPVMKSASAQLIGSQYRGITAEEGYQFYSVLVQIYNAGTDYLIPDYLDLYCEGSKDDDVYMEYFYEDYEIDMEIEDSFLYWSMEIIPACQTGEAELIMQVREGVNEVTLNLCRDYDMEEYETMDIKLQ